MALAVTLQIDYIDGKSKRSFSRMRLPTGFSIAQYGEFASDALQLIANVTGCRITGASLSFALDISASLTNIVSNLADVAEKGFFQFKSAVSGLFSKFTLPTFDADNFTIVGTDLIDEADTDVAALITLIEGGATVTGGTIDFVDKYGNDLVEVSLATEQFMEHH